VVETCAHVGWPLSLATVLGRSYLAPLPSISFRRPPSCARFAKWYLEAAVATTYEPAIRIQPMFVHRRIWRVLWGGLYLQRTGWRVSVLCGGRKVA